MPTRHFPAYLFLGEEDFLKEEAIGRLKSEFLDTRTVELNYSIFYAGERDFDIRKMLDTLNTAPFLSRKRLVILKDVDLLPSGPRQSVILYLTAPKDSSILVMESHLPVIQGEFLLEVSKLAKLVYYRRLTDTEIDSWITKKVSHYGKRISAGAISIIKESLSTDLRTIAANVDNIVLYVGKRSSITEDDVEEVVGVTPSRTAFDLLDSIERKDAASALRVFAVLKRDRKKETELLGLLAWNIRMILRIKELLRIKGRVELRRDMALSTRAFERIVRHAAGFEKGMIYKLLREIIKADIDIKTGASATEVMEQLVVKMCG